VPEGAVNLNVSARREVGALQGFGQLWQKTYRVELSGAEVTPAEVVRIWKERFSEFQPPQNRFYPSMAGCALSTARRWSCGPKRTESCHPSTAACSPNCSRRGA
jgi:putative component of membrane protein insertase Oxa1/YidC/SpoIIIJ protein YidD